MPHRVDPHRNIILIAANPRAGSQARGRALGELAEYLRDHEMVVEILSDLPKVEALANKLHAEGRLRALVGAGGDGTLAELINRTAPNLPIAIYPAGTANLVAKYIGATTNRDAFAKILLEGWTVELDTGRANGRLFMAVCSCGFDAEVVRRVHQARTGNISALAYLMPILSSVGNYAFPEMRVHYESASPLSARWAFVSNLPCYAGGLRPGAGADGQDGQLDFCGLNKGGLLSSLRYLPAMFAGRQSQLAECTTARASRFQIEAVDAEIPYELDGDPGGVLPVEIDILPRRLTLLVPRVFAEEHALNP